MKQNTKLTLGNGRFSVDDFPVELKNHNGLVAMPAIIDFTIGEEIVLYWIDRTPFIKEVAAQKPLRLVCHGGIYKTNFGPIIWFLFYVPPLDYISPPIASMEVLINPSETNHMSYWRRLVNQTHVHIALIGEGNQVHGFYEYENNFRIQNTLDVFALEFASFPRGDFLKAKEEFSNRYTLEELYALGTAPPEPKSSVRAKIDFEDEIESLRFVCNEPFGGGYELEIKQLAESGWRWVAVTTSLHGGYTSGPGSDKGPRVRPIEPENMQDLLKALKDSQISMLPPGPAGLDVATYELNIFHFSGELTLKWSGEDLAGGWYQLERVLNKLRSI